MEAATPPPPEQPPSADSQIKALQAMLAYLEARHANQMANAAQVDTKVTVQLTVSAAPLAFIVPLLPALKSVPAPCLFYLTVVVLVALVYSVAWMLRIALQVLSVKVSLPGVSAEAFRQLAASSTQDPVQLLRGLVRNATSAVEQNQQYIEARKPNTARFLFWSHASLALSLAAIFLLAYFYVASIAPAWSMPTTGSRGAGMTDGDSIETPTPPPSDQAPATSEGQVSVEQPPVTVDYGRTIPGERTTASVDEISIEADPTDIDFGKANVVTRLTDLEDLLGVSRRS